MNQKQIEFLSRKITQITDNLNKLEEAKKDLVSGYNREIRDSKKRAKIYAKAVVAETDQFLPEVMGEFELAEFAKIV